jgi:hypothetical protein
MGYLIYTLRHPLSDLPGYVGVTRNRPERRLREHMRDAVNKKRRCLRLDWIKSMMDDGHYPIMQVVEDVSVAISWNEREIYWISRYRRAGIQLYNMSDGGIGNTGLIVTRSVRRRLRKANLGKRLSEEHKWRIGLAHKGKTLTFEHRQRIAACTRAKMQDPAARAHISEKLKGRKIPPDVLARRIASQTGLKRSPEAIERMRIAARRRVDRQRSVAVL